MKFSFMTFSAPGLSWPELVQRAKELGYDGIEPRVQSRHAHGVELESTAAQRKSIRDIASDAGVGICCLAIGNRFADPHISASQIDETRRMIDLASDIHAPVVRLFGGSYPDTVSKQAAIDSQAKSMVILAEHAKSAGILLCMETHDAWCVPSDVAAVMQQANHPNVCVNWDVLHPMRFGWTLDDSFEVLKPWIRHVHAHDAILSSDVIKKVPIGTGIVDHGRVIELLRGIGYSGFVSGEWIEKLMSQEFYATHLQSEIATLRRLDQV